jgi:hypothetical protein
MLSSPSALVLASRELRRVLCRWADDGADAVLRRLLLPLLTVSALGSYVLPSRNDTILLGQLQRQEQDRVLLRSGSAEQALWRAARASVGPQKRSGGAGAEDSAVWRPLIV